MDIMKKNFLCQATDNLKLIMSKSTKTKDYILNDDKWKQVYNLSENLYTYDYFHNNIIYFYDDYYKVFVAKVLSKVGCYMIVSQDGIRWYPNKSLESLICLMKVNYSEWNY